MHDKANLVLGDVRSNGCDPSRLPLLDGEEHGLEVGSRIVAVQQYAVSLSPNAALVHADTTGWLCRQRAKETTTFNTLLSTSLSPPQPSTLNPVPLVFSFPIL